MGATCKWTLLPLLDVPEARGERKFSWARPRATTGCALGSEGQIATQTIQDYSKGLGWPRRTVIRKLLRFVQVLSSYQLLTCHWHCSIVERLHEDTPQCHVRQGKGLHYLVPPLPGSLAQQAVGGKANASAILRPRYPLSSTFSPITTTSPPVDLRASASKRRMLPSAQSMSPLSQVT